MKIQSINKLIEKKQEAVELLKISSQYYEDNSIKNKIHKISRFCSSKLISIYMQELRYFIDDCNKTVHAYYRFLENVYELETNNYDYPALIVIEKTVDKICVTFDKYLSDLNRFKKRDAYSTTPCFLGLSLIIKILQTYEKDIIYIENTKEKIKKLNERNKIKDFNINAFLLDSID